MDGLTNSNGSAPENGGRHDRTFDARLLIKACERCNGDLMLEPDDGYVCLQCGSRPARSGHEAQDAGTDAPTTVRLTLVSVGNLMNRNPDVVQDSDTVQNAARLMQQHGISSIPVCNGDRLVGVITEHDIVLRCVATGVPPAYCRVDQCMRESPASVPVNASLDEARQLMQGKQRRSICVTDEGRLVGMITLRQLVRYVREGERGLVTGAHSRAEARSSP